MNAAMTNFIIGLEKQRFPSISPRVRRAKRARGQPARGGWAGESRLSPRALCAPITKERQVRVVSQSQSDDLSTRHAICPILRLRMKCVL